MKVVLAALAAATLASTAFAGTVSNPFGSDAAVLSLKGVDLGTARGQQRLAIRVDQAARAVCGDNLSSVHLDLELRARDCRSDVAQQVREQVEARMASLSTPTRIAAGR